MLKTSSTSAAIRKPTGAPAPLPKPMASGMLPPITVSGAAAAMTMKTMPTEPSRPVRCGWADGAFGEAGAPVSAVSGRVILLP